MEDETPIIREAFVLVSARCKQKRACVSVRAYVRNPCAVDSMRACVRSVLSASYPGEPPKSNPGSGQGLRRPWVGIAERFHFFGSKAKMSIMLTPNLKFAAFEFLACVGGWRALGATLAATC